MHWHYQVVGGFTDTVVEVRNQHWFHSLEMLCCWHSYRNAYESCENKIVDLKYLYTLGYSNSFKDISEREPYFSLISGSVLKKHLALHWEFAGNLDYIPVLNAWPKRSRVSASRNIHWKTGCLSVFYQYSTTYWTDLKQPIAVVLYHKEQLNRAHFTKNHLRWIWIYMEIFVM